jgi:hypothetical protein
MALRTVDAEIDLAIAYSATDTYFGDAGAVSANLAT